MDRPVAHTLVTAAATWAVLGGRSLEREAEVMAGLLEAKDIPAARERLSHLCSRDATDLEADELARATVESVAENTSDASVAPLVWGGLLGVPGLVGYRAVEHAGRDGWLQVRASTGTSAGRRRDSTTWSIWGRRGFAQY